MFTLVRNLFAYRNFFLLLLKKNIVMPINKNALLRYRTIDRCLQNRYRRWTLDNLIEACSDALYEFTGKSDYVSKRTIQLDIQKMRSDELGYCAPIVVRDNKYYEYADPNYSITNTPLTSEDMQMMVEAVAILKQLSGFSEFSGMEDIVGKLEDHVGMAKSKQQPVIFYERNDGLKGLNYISPLYDAIIAKRPILIKYQSFRAKGATEFVFSPYCLKEFRNRWFVFGKRYGMKMLLNLALDRIINISVAPVDAEYIIDEKFDPTTYFDNMVGVSKSPKNKPLSIVFLAKSELVPYIETKPFHKSQCIVKRNNDGSAIFKLNVVLNYEIERDLISCGESIKVLKPRLLVKHICRRMKAAADQYNVTTKPKMNVLKKVS